MVKNLRGDIPKYKIVKNVQESPEYIRKGVVALSEHFGHKVEVKLAGENIGKLLIPFHSEEDFYRIKKLMQ